MDHGDVYRLPRPAIMNSAHRRPPASSLHPLSLLDEFLGSLETTNEEVAEQGNNNDDDDRSTCAADVRTHRPQHKHDDQQRIDRILAVADYLYGGSMLEAALAVLDADDDYCTSSERRCAGSGMIRQITSHPSNRKAFLVRGAAATSSSHWQKKTSAAGATDYFCLLPSYSRRENKNNDTTTATNRRDDGDGSIMMVPVQYCSCRSYFERAKSDTSGMAMCKHLLALKLMPALQCRRPTDNEGMIVPDAEFSSLLLQSMLPSSSSHCSSTH